MLTVIFLKCNDLENDRMTYSLYIWISVNFYRIWDILGLSWSEDEI